MSKSPLYDRMRRASRELGKPAVSREDLRFLRAERRAAQDARNHAALMRAMRDDLAFVERHTPHQTERIEYLRARIARLELR